MNVPTPVPPLATAMVVPFQIPSFTVPVVSIRKAFPAVPMEKRDNGEVVPMPTLPVAKTVNKVEVAFPAVVEAIVKSGVLTAVDLEFEIERSEYGLVVPMPSRLFVLSQKKLESAPSVAGVPDVEVQKGT